MIAARSSGMKKARATARGSGVPASAKDGGAQEPAARTDICLPQQLSPSRVTPHDA